MNELVKLLNKYASAYYQNDAPLISDSEYDALFDELLELEKQSGIVLVRRFHILNRTGILHACGVWIKLKLRKTFYHGQTGIHALHKMQAWLSLLMLLNTNSTV